MMRPEHSRWEMIAVLMYVITWLVLLCFGKVMLLILPAMIPLTVAMILFGVPRQSTLCKILRWCLWGLSQLFVVLVIALIYSDMRRPMDGMPLLILFWGSHWVFGGLTFIAFVAWQVTFFVDRKRKAEAT